MSYIYIDDGNDETVYPSLEAARLALCPSRPLSSVCGKLGSGGSMVEALTPKVKKGTGRPGTPVTVAGVEYPSLPAAIRALSPEGLTYQTVRARIAGGWDLELALTTAKGLRRSQLKSQRVHAFRQWYDSIEAFVEIEGETAENWAKEDCHESQLALTKRRMKRGWSPGHALMVDPGVRQSSIDRRDNNARDRLALRRRTGPVTSREDRLAKDAVVLEADRLAAEEKAEKAKRLAAVNKLGFFDRQVALAKLRQEEEAESNG